MPRLSDRWRRTSTDQVEKRCTCCRNWFVVSRGNFTFRRLYGVLIPQSWCNGCSNSHTRSVRRRAASELPELRAQAAFLSLPAPRIAIVGARVYPCPELACSRAT